MSATGGYTSPDESHQSQFDQRQKDGKASFKSSDGSGSTKLSNQVAAKMRKERKERPIKADLGTFKLGSSATDVNPHQLYSRRMNKAKEKKQKRKHESAMI